MTPPADKARFSSLSCPEIAGNLPCIRSKRASVVLCMGLEIGICAVFLIGFGFNILSNARFAILECRGWFELCEWCYDLIREQGVVMGESSILSSMASPCSCFSICSKRYEAMTENKPCTRVHYESEYAARKVFVALRELSTSPPDMLRRNWEYLPTKSNVDGLP